MFAHLLVIRTVNRPRTHVMNDLSTTIIILWKFHAALIQVVVSWLLSNFAHDTTAELLCHVQNFIAIWYMAMELTLKPNFHWIWITMKKSLVKWFPGPHEPFLISLTIFLFSFKFKSKLVSSDPYTNELIVFNLYTKNPQLCCSGLQKNLQQYYNQEWNDNNTTFPSNLNCDVKCVSEMDQASLNGSVIATKGTQRHCYPGIRMHNAWLFMVRKELFLIHLVQTRLFQTN